MPVLSSPVRPLLLTALLALAACRPTVTPPDAADTGPYRAGLTAERQAAQCTARLSALRERFQALEQQPAPHTVASLLRPVDRLLTDVNDAASKAFLINNVHPDEAVQAAADTCVQDLSKLLIDIGLSRPLYLGIEAIDTTDADAQTRRVQARFLRDFKRAGVDRDATERDRIRAINERITDLGQQFGKNIRSDVRSIELSGIDAIAGLPKDYIHRHPADEDGIITITTDYPDLFPFMRYSQDAQARRALYQQYLTRAWPANDDVLRQIINERHQLATLLGYDNFADYALEVMMVRDPDTVDAFINRIDGLASPRSRRDYDALLRALNTEYPEAQSVASWQKFYAEELVRQHNYQVDTKKVRQYFQYDHVKQGIFDLVQDLFGVEIKPWHTDTWDPSVEPYALWENGAVIGYFYLDMHPRAGKYKHAAQYDVQVGLTGEQLPIAALVCNFPGGDDPHALMEHQQVETFLHEFGHLLHHIFSGQQQWGIFSGVATERDFVEAPSQMLEEWIWDYDTLKRFARNTEGATIPRELVDRMRAARDFGRGVQIRNQMFYAALSLAYYSTDPQDLDLEQTMIDLQAHYSPFPYMPATYFYASFGHLYGYSTAYYTYMWSEVIAADILEQFKQQGMRNRELATRYRNTILAPGGSRDAAQLVEDFLGRPFTFDAFIERLND